MTVAASRGRQALAFSSVLPLRGCVSGSMPRVASARPTVACASTRVPRDITLYYVADVGLASSAGAELPRVAAAAAAGGARIVQFRDKTGRAGIAQRAADVRDAVRAGGGEVLFLVNDDVALAKEVRADGVHVGQDDVGVSEARAVLGDDAVVGVSAGTCEEAEVAIADGADYVGVGAVFATASKADAGSPIGLGKLADIVRTVNRRVPVVGIGGINMGNCGGCAVVGCDGVAVIRSITMADDPQAEAESIFERFEYAHFERSTGGKPPKPVVLETGLETGAR